ncbi:MAG: phosphate acyltransferase PlsX [Clostridia bacterium]|nr:phosphate acyltransferase PlsX [Clostridia bacterium]
MLILVDAMGGDNAPQSVVNGCMDAIGEVEGFDILLIGDSNKINPIIKERNFSDPRLKVHHASDVITNEDMPTRAIKNKKDSSMVVGFNLLKEKKGDVFLSAGNSGALMTGALLILGRIKGVDRPTIPALVPSKGGKVLLVDAGLNSVCKPINYLQFSIIGSIYMKKLFHIENPKVGLINIGVEEKKGTEVVKQAYALMRDSNANINFVGNIEGNDVAEGKVHVAVCDGFVGNILLKFYEGAGSFMMSILKGIFTKSIVSKVSALLIKGGLENFKKTMDRDENGGAPILGVNGNVVKSHGNSSARTIKHVVLKAYHLASSSVLEEIQEEFKNMEVDDIEFSE